MKVMMYLIFVVNRITLALYTACLQVCYTDCC